MSHRLQNRWQEGCPLCGSASFRRRTRKGGFYCDRCGTIFTENKIIKKGTLPLKNKIKQKENTVIRKRGHPYPTWLNPGRFKNAGRPWTPEEDRVGRQMRGKGCSLVKISQKLKRTKKGVQARNDIIWKIKEIPSLNIEQSDSDE